jgi:anti-sigma factor RsiW
MKPCSGNRKLLVWLTLDTLDARQERDLRAHLESCEGCRRYFQEISHAAEKLAAAEIGTEIQASESFHQRVAGALRAEETRSPWDHLEANLRAILPNRRMALSMIGAAALVVGALFMTVQSPTVSSPGEERTRAAAAPRARQDHAPTLFNYQMVANHSLEQLDDLLTREGNRNRSPAPIYTAATRLRAQALD